LVSIYDKCSRTVISLSVARVYSELIHMLWL